MSSRNRNNVKVEGAGERAMVFAHGFGCDQNMWRFVAPAFQRDFRTVLFDQVGAGHSDLSAYDPAKYASLSGYADDLVEIGQELKLRDTVFVGFDRRSAAVHSKRSFGRKELIVEDDKFDHRAESVARRELFCGQRGNLIGVETIA